MKTVTAVRNAFWEQHPEFKAWFKSGKRQNDYHCDIRAAFVGFVDYLARDGRITESLAKRVTL